MISDAYYIAVFTVFTIHSILLAVTTYQGQVACQLSSMNISYQLSNTSLECIPIEFDSPLVQCSDQTQGYCFDGSNVCYFQPFYQTVIQYSLTSDATSDIRENTITLKGLDTFPNASVVDLEHTPFHCYTQVKLIPLVNRLYEGHASQESLAWFIVCVIIATFCSLPIILEMVLCSLIRYRRYYPIRREQGNSPNAIV